MLNKILQETNPDVLILDTKKEKGNESKILERLEENANLNPKEFLYLDERGNTLLKNRYRCIERFVSKITPNKEISRQLEELADEITNKNIVYSIINNEDNMKNIYSSIVNMREENIHTVKAGINTATSNM